jgi:hypothetical protein
MRNLVIHDYSKTDVPAIWNVVEQVLPQLRRTIGRMLRETDGHGHAETRLDGLGSPTTAVRFVALLVVVGHG